MLGPNSPNGFDGFQQEPRPAAQISAISIGAGIDQWGEKGMQQIAMRCVQLEYFIA